MSKNYYDILGLSKTASDADIKKAYKKLAMQYHPDRNKGDKTAEKKFKEVNEAYQVLGDKEKKKNYDQFGSADGNPFGGMGGNPFGGAGGQSYGSYGGGAGFDFGDIFSQFGGGGRAQSGGYEFDMGDLFGGMGQQSRTHSRRQAPEPDTPKETISLDVTETVEIPFLDFLYDTSVSVKTVYGKTLSLKVKAGTKPGTKFKIAGKGRSTDGKTGDMFVIVDAKMPKMPLDPTVAKMVDAIRYQV